MMIEIYNDEYGYSEYVDTENTNDVLNAIYEYMGNQFGDYVTDNMSAEKIKHYENLDDAIFAIKQVMDEYSDVEKTAEALSTQHFKDGTYDADEVTDFIDSVSSLIDELKLYVNDIDADEEY